MVSPAARGEVIWDSDGTLWAQNVVHFRLSGTPAITQDSADGFANLLAQEFGNDVGGVIGTSLQDSISSSNRLHSVRISDLAIINPTVFTTDILLAGLGGPDQAPDTISLPVELVVGPGARNGRVFQWGFNDAANGPTGRPTLQAVDATVQFWDRLRISANAISGVEALAVLRRQTITQPNPDSTTDCTVVRRSPGMVAAGWSTQRRRRDGLQLLV